MHSRRIALGALSLLVASLAAAQSRPTRYAGPALPAAPSPSEPAGMCPPGAIFFTQNTDQTPDLGNGVTCAQIPPAPPYHRDTSWWRTYEPELFGALGPVRICQIEFGVETSVTPGATGQPITFRVGVSLDKPFPDGFRLVLGEVNTMLPDLTNSLFVVPVDIEVPSGAEVFIEAHVPDGASNQYILFPGGSADPENTPLYWSSEICGFEDPVTMAELGFPQSHTFLNFRGTEIPMLPSALVIDGDPNFVLHIGDPAAAIQTSWTNFFASPQTVTSTFEPVYANGAILKNLPDATASYGSMPVGVETSCVTTGDCPEGTISGTKGVAVDEDVFLAETLTLPPPPPLAPEVGEFPDKIWELHVGGSFFDVQPALIFYPFIENIFHHGVTGGCGNANYCPGNPTLRKQMAVFLLKAFEGAAYLPPPATGVFDDVPAADPFAPWIEELAARGITGGCGTDLYCPDNAVLRKQMAVFLLKTLLGSTYAPPAPAGIFDDVLADGFRPFIEDLYNRGITGGCSGGPPPAPISYCPENAVTRGQMAPFLVKTFGLRLYGP